MKKIFVVMALFFISLLCGCNTGQVNLVEGTYIAESVPDDLGFSKAKYVISKVSYDEYINSKVTNIIECKNNGKSLYYRFELYFYITNYENMYLHSIKYCPASRTAYTAQIKYESASYSIDKLIMFDSRFNTINWSETNENGEIITIHLNFDLEQ